MKILLELESCDTRMGAVNDALDLVRFGRPASLEYVLCGPVSPEFLQEAARLEVQVLPRQSRQLARRQLHLYGLDVCQWLWHLRCIRPDVIHLNYASWGASLACAGRLMGIPVVARGGGTYDARNYSHRWVSGYAANCAAQAEALLNSPVADQVAIVGDLINTKRFETVASSGALPVKNVAAVKILFLGQLVERKGLHVLVQAAAGVAGNFELHLVGGDWSKGDYPRRIRELIAGQGVENRVQLHNHRDDAIALLQECDLLVLPSLSEARPRIIIEAMLLGKCVVATDTGGIPTLVEHGTSGLLVPPGEVAPLAAALTEVINDAPLRKRLGNAAQQRAGEMFDINRTIAAYRALYERAVCVTA
jgi:glycosyltransferase involved in cell wall biosynthesis